MKHCWLSFLETQWCYLRGEATQGGEAFQVDSTWGYYLSWTAHTSSHCLRRQVWGKWTMQYSAVMWRSTAINAAFKRIYCFVSELIQPCSHFAELCLWLYVVNNTFWSVPPICSIPAFIGICTHTNTHGSHFRDHHFSNSFIFIAILFYVGGKSLAPSPKWFSPLCILFVVQFEFTSTCTANRFFLSLSLSLRRTPTLNTAAKPIQHHGNTSRHYFQSADELPVKWMNPLLLPVFGSSLSDT